MHYYRVALSGSSAATAAVAAEIGQPGGESRFVVAREETIEFWESLSRRHRGVAFGIESFEEFGDELVHVVIHGGETTEMSRESLRPRYQVWLEGDEGDPWDELSDEAAEFVEWFDDDENGEPIDEDRVRMAAGLISAARLRYGPQACDDGLAIALMIGKALGRLCRRTEATAREEPSADAIDAVVEIAVHALCMRRSSDPCPAERDFQQALTLTRSAVHAACDRYYHEPWSDWLRLVIGGVGHVLDAATSPHVDGSEHEFTSWAAEHHSTASEMLDLEVHGLLTTCVQALALFVEADRAPV